MVRYDYDRYDYTEFFRDDRRDQERIERMIDDARREMDREERQEDPIMRVINDPYYSYDTSRKNCCERSKGCHEW